MPKLPVISGRKAVKVFEQLGFRVVRQKGSHIVLRRVNPDASFRITENLLLERYVPQSSKLALPWRNLSLNPEKDNQSLAQLFG